MSAPPELDRDEFRIADWVRASVAARRRLDLTLTRICDAVSSHTDAPCPAEFLARLALAIEQAAHDLHDAKELTDADALQIALDCLEGYG
jgi:hypothetical protein